MPTTEQKIALLQGQLDELKAELAGKQQANVASPHVERSVSISRAIERPADHLLPSDGELEKLLDIVECAYPKLRPSFDGKFADMKRQDHVAGFKQAFHWLACVGRQDKLDTTRALSWWVDHAETWLRENGTSSPSVNGNALVVAVLAWGDISFASLDRFPFDLAFGVSAYGGARPTSPTWRHVLDTGKIKPGVDLPTQKTSKTVDILFNGRSVESYATF